MTVGHMQVNPPVIQNIADDAKLAQDSGIAAVRKNRAASVVGKHSTASALIRSALMPNPAKTAKQAPASQQAQATRQAQAVALMAPAAVSPEKIKESRRFFSTITVEDDEYLDLHVSSMVKSIGSGNKHLSLVDTLYRKEKGPTKKLLKYLVLKIALENPQRYRIDDEMVAKLEAIRADLYENSREEIEGGIFAIEMAEDLAPKVKIGVKHLLQTFQMSQRDETTPAADLVSFIRTLNVGPNEDPVTVLKLMKAEWVALSKRDQSQYPIEVTRVRQHILHTKINQATILIYAYTDLETVAALCRKCGIEQIPDSRQVLQELALYYSDSNLGAASRLSKILSVLCKKGVQIYVTGLSRMIGVNPLFKIRNSEKNYIQLKKVINELLTKSYYRSDSV